MKKSTAEIVVNGLIKAAGINRFKKVVAFVNKYEDILIAESKYFTACSSPFEVYDFNNRLQNSSMFRYNQNAVTIYFERVAECINALKN